MQLPLSAAVVAERRLVIARRLFRAMVAKDPERSSSSVTAVVTSRSKSSARITSGPM
jgi:hypothetical protein